jgi:membrane protein insertase Oxa1/YidC/SpoIIIJ
MQKRMGYIMPPLFTVLFKAAPAGLVLYWMVGSRRYRATVCDQ